MCGRFQLSVRAKEITKRYQVEVFEERYVPKYNCAPGQLLPVITNKEPEVLNFYRWGLIPSWAKDVSIGNRLINARAETIDQKPAFKKAFYHQRCLVPANGFYEWRKSDKQPFRIFLKDEPVFSMAGIWEVWPDAEKRPLYTFAIITTASMGAMEKIHDRMPVILTPEEEREWLTSEDPGRLKSLLKPVTDDRLTYYPVSEKVNNVQNEGKELLYPVNLNKPPTLFD